MTQELRDTITKAMGKAYQLGQIYWQQADSDFESQHKKADVTAAKFKVLQAETNEAILSLLDRLEKAEKDAARLDWLRSIGHEQLRVMGHYSGPAMDKEIDAAIEAAKGANK